MSYNSDASQKLTVVKQNRELVEDLTPRVFRLVRGMHHLQLVRRHPRQHPVQASAPVTAGGGRHSAHPPQQANPAYFLDFGAGGLVRPRRRKVPDQQHHQPACDV